MLFHRRNLGRKKRNVDGEYFDVLHFTSTGNDCCNLGDRVPAVLAYHDRDQMQIGKCIWSLWLGIQNFNSVLALASDIGNKANMMWYADVEFDTWYHLEIAQQRENNGVPQSYIN